MKSNVLFGINKISDISYRFAWKGQKVQPWHINVRCLFMECIVDMGDIQVVMAYR
ncbi:hypothetical protein JCM21142_83208 [Saccharicrinis fermentans DSM 9555 = JCM 21142]|uniref:Uncharacterized protein n=2 Tax=Saccharicrinis fermentans TaxID=982 RepID=W7Y0P8_9BACT|nr:hypothetical protein JCM21142_83208 [Saccharicrinis fermentans DSM 9555 = JCM 21142]